ncbi:MAG: hypothetical protein M1837_006453 [Sclerophora amabilis]|nr:MAG: hypothetical protein M1837_006453 [Sclerophora amabilis]
MFPLDSIRATTSSLVASLDFYLKRLATHLNGADSLFSASTQRAISRYLDSDSLSSPHVLYTTVLLLLTLVVVSMSGWGKQYWGGGRLSPIGALGHPPRVSDEDYSYITADDIPNHSAHGSSRPPPPTPLSAEDDDILFLRKGGSVYSVVFPAFSIDNGQLTVGILRAEAARILRIGDAKRLKLFYKGRNLKDDYRTCLEEGLAVNSELMCVGSDDLDERQSQPTPSGEAGSEAGSDTEEDDTSTGGGERPSRKKRHRTRKKKSRKPDPHAGSASGANLAPPVSAAAGRSRSTSPGPPPVPKSPLGKLDDISLNFRAELLPQCVQFTTNPPSDPAKKDFEHKKLTETILSQVLIKLDAVETEGDPEARQRRKDLVQEAQDVLSGLDAILKKGRS